MKIHTIIKFWACVQCRHSNDENIVLHILGLFIKNTCHSLVTICFLQVSQFYYILCASGRLSLVSRLSQCHYILCATRCGSSTTWIEWEIFYNDTRAYVSRMSKFWIKSNTSDLDVCCLGFISSWYIDWQVGVNITNLI